MLLLWFLLLVVCVCGDHAPLSISQAQQAYHRVSAHIRKINNELDELDEISDRCVFVENWVEQSLEAWRPSLRSCGETFLLKVALYLDGNSADLPTLSCDMRAVLGYIDITLNKVRGQVGEMRYSSLEELHNALREKQELTILIDSLQ